MSINEDCRAAFKYGLSYGEYIVKKKSGTLPKLTKGKPPARMGHKKKPSKRDGGMERRRFCE